MLSAGIIYVRDYHIIAVYKAGQIRYTRLNDISVMHKCNYTLFPPCTGMKKCALPLGTLNKGNLNEDFEVLLLATLTVNNAN